MIKNYWQLTSEKFDALAKRERLILLMAVLALVYLVWSLLLLNPVSARIDNLGTQTESLGRQILDLQAQEQTFSLALGQDPLAGKKRQVAQLRERLTALDEELQSLAVGLVPANMLPQVLHDVLAGTGNLALLGMQTLPVQRVVIAESVSGGSTEIGSAETAETSPQQVDVYRHSVELQVRGSYFAVADYLQALEDLPWRFYWDQLNYQVETYPTAIATMQVYTLSAGEGPLGDQ